MNTKMSKVILMRSKKIINKMGTIINQSKTRKMKLKVSKKVLRKTKVKIMQLWMILVIIRLKSYFQSLIK